MKLKDKYPLYVANEARQTNTDLKVTDKYTGEVATLVALADSKIIDEGIEWAVKAAEPMAKMPAYERQAVLQHCVDRFIERKDDGKCQLTVNGWPMYFYEKDKRPGDTKGQGVGGVWWLTRPSGAKITTGAGSGGAGGGSGTGSGGGSGYGTGGGY